MERDLLVTLKQASDAVKTLTRAKADAQVQKDRAAEALSAYLESTHASATGRYDIGWAKQQPSKLFASVTESAWPEVMAWYRLHDASCIKESIHPSTLNQSIGDFLRRGIALPAGVTYYLKPQFTLYGGSNE